MHYRYFQAVASCAAAIALATTTTVTHAAEWTSFKVGTLSSYTLGYTSLADGRFAIGTNGEVLIQNTFGSAKQTTLTNSGGVVFDPSFVAIRSATSGLIGGGGYSGASGLYPFDPSTPATTVARTPLTSTLQNYGAVYWRHPTSGHEGWLVGGANGDTGNHNVSFVSADGTHVGPVTGELCVYSSGIAADAAGNLYTSLDGPSSAPDFADSQKVLKFTADQVDAAVLAILGGGATAAVPKASATTVFQFDEAVSIAVDSLGRVWAAGFSADYLQVYDPSLQLTRRFTPDHAKLAKAQSVPAYQVSTFARAGVNYVSFLANDSAFNFGSDVVYGYKSDATLAVRAVTFDVAAKTVAESAGTVTVKVNISPAPTMKVTVPLTYSGTATSKSDYTGAASVVFNVGATSATFDIKVIDDAVQDALPTESLIVKLGTPSPVNHAGLGAAGTDTYTLSITDNDVKPTIAAAQTFGTGRVGTDYSYSLATTGGTATVKYTSTILPHGLTIDATTGVISGRPTVPGEYDQVTITATSTAGTTTSVGYLIVVDDFTDVAKGSFVGYTDRDGTAGSLGARLDVTVTTNAAFTGKVTIGSKPYTLSGLLDTSTANPAGHATFLIGTTSYAVDFIINATSGGLTGTVGTSSIIGWRAQTATTLAGLYNFFAATPGGPAANDPHGATYGTTSVVATGTATTTIHAADGTVFTTAAPVGPAGETLVYATAYKVPGTLVGGLTIASSTPHATSGGLTWSNPVQATGGWVTPIALTAKGGRYRPVSGSGVILSLADSGTTNATLHFQDGALAAPFTLSLRLAAPAVAVIPAPTKLAITNATGAFSGSFVVGSGKTAKTVTFQGVVVPDATTDDLFDGTGEGYFLMPGTGSVVSRSGMVSLTAAF